MFKSIKIISNKIKIMQQSFLKFKFKDILESLNTIL